MIGFVVADDKPSLLATNVYPVAARLSVKPEKVVTPALAVVVTVPPRLDPPGLAASVSVTLLLKLVATFPKLSSAVTTIPKGAPAVRVAGGWVEMTNCEAAAATIVMLLVVAALRLTPDVVSVYPAAAWLSVKPEKVATPALAFIVSGPPRVAPPGFAASARVTLLL